MIKISDKEIIEALNRVAKTDDGKVMLAWLKHTCNWDMTLMSNEPYMTAHYASIRAIWGRIRQSIHNEELKQIEHDYVVHNEITKQTKKAGK